MSASFDMQKEKIVEPQAPPVEVERDALPELFVPDEESEAAPEETALSPLPAQRQLPPETVVYSSPQCVARNRLAQLEGGTRGRRIWRKIGMVIGFVMAMVIFGSAFDLSSSNFTHMILQALFAVGLAYSVAALMTRSLNFSPDRIRFSDAGIRLQWKKRPCPLTSPLVEWNQISYVGVSQWKGVLFSNNWLDLHVQTATMKNADKEFLSWFFRDFWSTKDRCRMYIDLEGIVMSDEARKLFEELSKYVPQERIDPQLLELLNPLKPESYTELWMSSLSSSKQRLRLEPLKSGVKLHRGRYQILDQIGAGGQGIAYSAALLATASGADEKATGGSAVLKEFILPAHGGGAVRQRSLNNIEREAELLKQIAHPHIVHLIDYFVEDERAYLVMEHLDGQSLRSLIESNGPMDEKRAKNIALQLCEILTHLHSQETPVIHRDFTPENIMISLEKGDFATLIDFNVAQQLQSTATRTVVGKHSYIPPEQFRGKATIKSDMYALGATIAFMLTGVDPEPISSSHPREKNASVSVLMDKIVARATKTDENERYCDVEVLRQELLAC